MSRVIVRLFLASLWLLISAAIVRSIASAPSPLGSAVSLGDAETGAAVRADLILLNGKRQILPAVSSARSDLGISKWLPGRHRVHIQSPGHKPWSALVTVPEQDALPIRIFLDPLELPPELRPDQVARLRKTDALLIHGFVVDDITGELLPEVKITCLERNSDRHTSGLVARSNGQGYFHLSVPITDQENDALVDLSFVLPGFVTRHIESVQAWPGGDWTFRVRLIREQPRLMTQPADGVESESMLREDGFSVTSEAPDSLFGLTEGPLGPLVAAPTETSGLAATIEPMVRVPRMIRVLASDGASVDYVDLDAYCRRVLPSEWIASWANSEGGINALKAGAVAIRTYAINSVNHPANARYDICGTTACQVYGSATSTATDTAVAETDNYVMVQDADKSAIGFTEYSAENNSLGFPCGDAFTSPTTGCLSDPVCQGQTRSGHGRGLCQWGSARWATGLRFPGNSTRDRTTPNGQARQDWTWILEHYYPDLHLSRGTPLTIGDAVIAATAVNVRACPGQRIDEGIHCPVVGVQSEGEVGTVVGGPLQVLTDGSGYTWYQVQWPGFSGWSVENYLQRLSYRPVLTALITPQGFSISWPSSPGFTFRLQSTDEFRTGWSDVAGVITSAGSTFSWKGGRTDARRFYRLLMRRMP